MSQVDAICDATATANTTIEVSADIGRCQPTLKQLFELSFKINVQTRVSVMHQD